jgi:nicotinamidase-related amidase
MPAKNQNLHGNAPDSCEAALLLIDDLEFPAGRQLVKPALRAARHIAALKQSARKLGMPVIYANDNFGRWRSDFAEVVDHCLREDVLGRPIVEILAPEREDYFVLKPKHSAFYASVLETLLDYLKVKRVVICGFAGDACVLLTAADAYIRDLEVYVPRDCVASASELENRKALQYMARVLHANTLSSTKLDVRKLAGRTKAPGKRARP